MSAAANFLLLIVAVAVHVIWIRSLVEWDGSPCDAADCFISENYYKNLT